MQPKIVKKQIGRANSPWVAITNMILTVTEELCTTAVTSIPTTTAKSGFFRLERVPTTAGESFRLSIEPDIKDNPMNKIPNPNTTSPIFFTMGFFKNITIITPTNKNNGAISDKSRDTNWDVTVVPMFAPMITPAAWVKVISPAFTKLTTITVAALEDWMIAVNTVPTSTPTRRFLVITSKIFRSLAPAAFSRPSLIIFIPNRNRPRPPNNDKNMLIAFSSCILSDMFFPAPYHDLSVPSELPQT